MLWDASAKKRGSIPPLCSSYRSQNTDNCWYRDLLTEFTTRTDQLIDHSISNIYQTFLSLSNFDSLSISPPRVSWTASSRRCPVSWNFFFDKIRLESIEIFGCKPNAKRPRGLTAWHVLQEQSPPKCSIREFSWRENLKWFPPTSHGPKIFGNYKNIKVKARKKKHRPGTVTIQPTWSRAKAEWPPVMSMWQSEKFQGNLQLSSDDIKRYSLELQNGKLFL